MRRFPGRQPGPEPTAVGSGRRHAARGARELQQRHHRQLAGEDVGTLFTAQGTTLAARKRWIGWTAQPRGWLAVDDGACQAVERQGRSLLAIGVAMVVGFATLAPRYDLTAAGQYAGQEQRAGRPLLYVGNYQGELGFYGRLLAPVRELPPEAAGAWIRRHPDGLVITRRKRLRQHGPLQPEFAQRYKDGELLMFRAPDLEASGSGFVDPAKAVAR